MVLYQSFWSRFRREALLFVAVYATCLLLAVLFNLVSFGSERLQLSVPLHEAPNKEAYMLQALAPLPIEQTRTIVPSSAEEKQSEIKPTMSVKKK